MSEETNPTNPPEDSEKAELRRRLAESEERALSAAAKLEAREVASKETEELFHTIRERNQQKHTEGASAREAAWLTEEVRRLSRLLESMASLPHEVARLSKELEAVKGTPRDLARATGTWTAGQRSAETRLKALEESIKVMADGQKAAGEKIEHVNLETSHLERALEGVRALAQRAGEFQSGWNAVRHELESRLAALEKACENMPALQGLPQRFAALAEARVAAEDRLAARIAEIETRVHKLAENTDMAGRELHETRADIEKLRAELTPLRPLPGRLETQGQSHESLKRNAEDRLALLEAAAREFERRAGGLEAFAGSATRHLEDILQKVGEALPQDALERLCLQIERLEGKVAALETRLRKP